MLKCVSLKVNFGYLFYNLDDFGLVPQIQKPSSKNIILLQDSKTKFLRKIVHMGGGGRKPVFLLWNVCEKCSFQTNMFPHMESRFAAKMFLSRQ